MKKKNQNRSGFFFYKIRKKTTNYIQNNCNNIIPNPVSQPTTNSEVDIAPVEEVTIPETEDKEEFFLEGFRERVTLGIEEITEWFKGLFGVDYKNNILGQEVSEQNPLRVHDISLVYYNDHLFKVIELNEEISLKDAETQGAFLVMYNLNLFKNKKPVQHIDFHDSMLKIISYAEDVGVQLYITSTGLRDIENNIHGAIVVPARHSNHHIGHSLDLNLVVDGEHCGGECMQTSKKLKVRKFIKLIQEDSILRWGGDFKKKDPVHIDDGYNYDLKKWKFKLKQIYEEKK